MSPEPAGKKHPQYELLYHPSTPGRAEFVRLAFEAARVPYTDVANSQSEGYETVKAICMNQDLESAEDNPPVFAPPALRIPGAGRDGQQALIIHQTPVILHYLGERLSLVPTDEAGKCYVQQLTMTALDVNNEVHDTHHPIAVMKFYADQKPEALAKATDFRANRLPKYLSYFQRALLYNSSRGGEGRYLVGEQLTYADTTLWQLLDGLFYAFPREMEGRKEKFKQLLVEFYGSIREEKGLKEYLSSGRRLKYSMG